MVNDSADVAADAATAFADISVDDAKSIGDTAKETNLNDMQVREQRGPHFGCGRRMCSERCCAAAVVQNSRKNRGAAYTAENLAMAEDRTPAPGEYNIADHLPGPLQVRKQLSRSRTALPELPSQPRTAGSPRSLTPP